MRQGELEGLPSSASLRLSSVTDLAGVGVGRLWVWAYTCSPAAMEAGGGAGSLGSATPSMSKQLSASRSIGCGSKLRLPLVSKYGALSLEFLCPSLAGPGGGAAIDHEPSGPQAGLGLPHLSEGGAWSETGLTCFAPPLPTCLSHSTRCLLWLHSRLLECV